MDPREYRAHTARAACMASPGFVLMGRKLRPLSACHRVLLRSLGLPLLADADLPLITLEAISILCSQRMPDGDLSRASQRQLVEGPWIQVDLATLYDLDHENDQLDAWLLLCHDPAPALRNLKGLGDGGTWECRIGDEEYKIQTILKHTHGYTRDELRYDFPLAELDWEYQKVIEVRDQQSYITLGGEPEAEPSPAEKAEEARVVALRGKIHARYNTELAALGKPGSKKYQAGKPALDLAKKEMLDLARAGRLDADLNFLPPPEGTV